MASTKTRIVVLAAAALSALAVFAPCLLWQKEAVACGAFFRPAAKRAPSLTYERTLIVFDADKEREDFVREVVFEQSRDPFGFVVPTPALPEVAAVATSPFDALERSFPFETRGDGMRRGGGGGGERAKAGATPGGVQVLSKEKIGSFTAFVLAATDTRALSGWLKKNGFVSSPASDAWLAHYVKLSFHYVAMRYNPPVNVDGRAKAETIRISFDAPLPYYPYREPPRPEEARGNQRMLDLWLATKSRLVPVSAREISGQLRWVRPLASGTTTMGPGARDKLARVLGDAIAVPQGDNVVQRFADQKQSRDGFGDIVFVPDSATPASPERTAKLTRFLALVNPSLAGAP